MKNLWTTPVLDWLGDFITGRTFLILFGCCCLVVLAHTIFEYRTTQLDRMAAEESVNNYIRSLYISLRIPGRKDLQIPGGMRIAISKHDHYTVTWPNKNNDTYCVKSFEGEHSNGPYRLHLMGKGVVIIANGRIRKAFKDTCPLEDY